jgi:drug/metabolite transporter (DMT)-like permease
MSPQLIALTSALSYAFCIISARLGLRYSNSTTVTYVSLLVHTSVLWPIVFLRGVPSVPLTALALFLIAGSLQPAIRLFTYTGIAKIGAARSYALRASAPLFSAVLAIIFLGEKTTLPIVAGTLAIVAGIFMTSWESGGKPVRWLYLALPISAALLAGIAQPIRRQALSIANEPLFFAAIVGAISLVWYVIYLALPGTEKPVWNRKSLVPFLSAGLFETLGIWLSIAALSRGTVVVVTPLLSTSPVWVLIISSIFLRHVERITWKITLGTLGVVAGTIIIALWR